MSQTTPKHPPVVLSEFNEAKEIVAIYTTGDHGGLKVERPKASGGHARSILNAFLPAGYPHSVSHDYLEYQIYDSLQAFSSSIAGLLSNRAVLEGIGVGSTHTTPTHALLLSVLQDSLGRIATILFAHRLGRSLEPECKTYRLLADIFNDSAMVLDCLSPALPKPTRVALLAFSSCLRSLCGVAAGSSKASLSSHFAIQGNLGELNAKDSSQETIISLLGMLVGSLVVGHITTKWETWISLIFLLAIHLGTNYLAVRAVSMRTLNRQRSNIVFSEAIEVAVTSKEAESPGLELLKPEEVSLRERIFEKDGVLRWQGGRALGYCRIGVSLEALYMFFMQYRTSKDAQLSLPLPNFHELLAIYNEQGYIMMCDGSSSNFLIVIKEKSSNTTLLLAWVHALYHAKYWHRERREGESHLKTLWRTKKTVQALFLRHHLIRTLDDIGWEIENGALETTSGTRVGTYFINKE
ncbi:vitamin B6 photo-protection and homoeostasis-domain-containing protein [Amylocarpus encephaloides]|uniref:Vitamin B6 photo-protection and homoeostasis-domain-containing protein n=1 Tax=Amylocarpus encephaloides TaxID=45428 RepID=A0A9P8C0L7_9HELO|nr:vitamin B6 photo-protection and homoeostasis-domain-containing protein [Amylocarpus encephaloides]